jgi:integrase/recombinase XerD
MKWEAKIIKHKGDARIAVLFDKEKSLIERIKQVEGSRWSQSLRLWHLPDTIDNRIRFKIEFPVTNSLGRKKRTNYEILSMAIVQKI